MLGDLKRLVDSIGYAATARRLGVHEKTVKRWHTGATKPTGAVLRLIRADAAIAFGDLCAIGPGWDGWRLCPDGLLYAPELKHGFAPGDLRAAFFMRQHIQILEQELAKARATADALKDQPRTVHAPNVVTLNGGA